MNNNVGKVKARVISVGKREPISEEIKKKEERQAKIDTFQDIYGSEILEPPISYLYLADYHLVSNILPQCVDAMKQNCEGFGYNLIPIVEEEDVDKHEKEIKSEIKKAKNFFDFVSYNMSFTQLRKEVRKDIETFGNGYYEVIRNNKGDIAGFEYIKSYDVRLTKLTEKVEVSWFKRKVDSYDYEEVKIKRQFRRFVQIIGDQKVWFKEFGDPRTMNCRTGKFEDGIPDDDVANELIWFRLGSISSAYGLPRWIGNYKSILGSSNVEDVNCKYFDNKAIPPMAILVNNGVLEEDSVKMIEEYIENNIRGKDNFYNILILEAVGQGNANSLEQSKCQIEIKELTQIKDAQFLNYDKDNRDKIRSAFRLPPIYVGYTEDFTRATAKESREVAEEQIFKPERSDYDFFISNQIFPAMDIKYLRFESKAAPEDKDKELVEMFNTMVGLGLTYKEARKLAERISGIKLEDIDADWIDMPIKLSPYLIQLKIKEQFSSAMQQAIDDKRVTTEDVIKVLSKFRNNVMRTK